MDYREEDYQQEESRKILGLPLQAIIAIISFGIVIVIACVLIANSSKISVSDAAQFLTDKGYLVYAFEKDFDMGNYKIVNIASGTSWNDAINKEQLDNSIDGLNTDIDFLNNQLGSMNTDIGDLQAMCNTQEENLGTVNGIIDTINDGITSLWNEIADLTNSIASMMNVTGLLNNSVTTIEDTIGTLIAIPQNSTEGDILAYVDGVWSRIPHAHIADWINGTVTS